MTSRGCLGVYLLKAKSQDFDIFRNFHLWIKNEAQLNIGTLRTDNGGEYTSQDFEKYLQGNGIKHQTTFLIIHSKMVWQNV